MPKNQKIETYKKIGGIELDGPSDSAEKISYLIDGHQRVSTLFGALYGSADDDNDEVRWPLFYELGTENRPAFRVPPRRIASIGLDEYSWDNLDPVAPVSKIRTSTGRTKAFLLFMAGLPENRKARQRRQEWLGQENERTVPSLFSKAQGELPGNRVIASASELRSLRDAIETGKLTKVMADEYGISTDALNAQNPDEFLKKRTEWLIQEENQFIIDLGLLVSDSDT